MNVLVWQWGRRGAGPRFAACLADALRAQAGITVSLSLCRDAELMAEPTPPRCELPVRTYRGVLSLLLRWLTAPFALPALLLRLRRLAPEIAICAMPGPLDLLMAAALRLIGARLFVIVHDADKHPGDGFPGQMALQRLLCRAADGLITLCAHVGRRVRQQRLTRTHRPAIAFRHPPFGFPACTPDTGHVRPRLLCFGRLLPYKGLDLLGAALRQLPTGCAEVRIVGCGPACAALDELRAVPGVAVENRWVPEAEIGSLLAWSDAVILPYREASQSGVAAAALAAGRIIIATRVGGLAEQLATVSTAILCDPTEAGIAGAIETWLQDPLAAAPPIDAAAAWRTAADDLLAAIAAQVPSRRAHRRPGPRRLGAAPY
jgi:glycosyltransferase involved in cell wall biosynthesis